MGPMAEIEPKINRKAALRIAIFAFLVAGGLLVYQFLRNAGQDLTGTFGGGDTTGYIAAIQEHDDGGSQIVAIKPDGTLVPAEGHKAGNIDRDPAWPADGKFLYFISDRDKNESHLFRWDIDRGKVERKTLDKRTKTSTWCAPKTFENASASIMLISGGKVIELDPRTSEAKQILPPVSKEIGGGDEGSQSQFDLLYSKLGTSFKEAKWGKDRAWIAAILRQENGGEVLIVQDAAAAQPPTALVAGDRIEFDISPATDSLIYTVINFGFPDSENPPPQFVKNGKIVKPFHHAFGVYSPSGGETGPIATSKDDHIVFLNPRYAPDGQTALMLVGDQSSGSLKVNSLVVIPANTAGSQNAGRILDGDVSQASWGPDGETIVYVKADGGKRAVFTIQKDGSGEKNWTGDKGNFTSPLISPRTKSGS